MNSIGIRWAGSGEGGGLSFGMLGSGGGWGNGTGIGEGNLIMRCIDIYGIVAEFMIDRVHE